MDTSTQVNRPVPDLEGPKPTYFRWWVLGLIFIIYVVASADRANIGIVLPYLKEEFALSNTQAGAIASLFFLAYSAGQVPSAFLVKRYGVRRVLPISFLLTSIATGFHGIANSILVLKVCRIFLGLAEAPIAISCVTSINNWFPAKEKGIAAGIFIAAVKVGPVIAPPLAAVIILSMGWHYVFLLFAIPGLVLPFIWMHLVPNAPRGSRYVNAAETALIENEESPASGRTEQISVRESGFNLLDRLIRAKPVRKITTSRGAFTSWNIWGASLSYFLFVGVMNVILTWLPTYLMEVKGFSILSAGFMASTPFVGAVAGNLVGGWASDRLLDKRRKPLMMVSCLSTIVMMYALRSSPNDTLALALLLGLTGFALSLGFSLFAIFPAGLTDRKTFPIATSILNTCGQLGGAAMPLLTGIILDRYSWSEVFLVLAACGFVALLFIASVVEPRGEYKQA